MHALFLRSCVVSLFIAVWSRLDDHNLKIEFNDYIYLNCSITIEWLYSNCSKIQRHIIQFRKGVVFVCNQWKKMNEEGTVKGWQLGQHVWENAVIAWPILISWIQFKLRVCVLNQARFNLLKVHGFYLLLVIYVGMSK
jgi:hypothetical protein